MNIWHTTWIPINLITKANDRKPYFSFSFWTRNGQIQKKPFNMLSLLFDVVFSSHRKRKKGKVFHRHRLYRSKLEYSFFSAAITFRPMKTVNIYLNHWTFLLAFVNFSWQIHFDPQSIDLFQFHCRILIQIFSLSQKNVFIFIRWLIAIH